VGIKDVEGISSVSLQGKDVEMAIAKFLKESRGAGGTR